MHALKKKKKSWIYADLGYVPHSPWQGETKRGLWLDVQVEYIRTKQLLLEININPMELLLNPKMMPVFCGFAY